MKCILVMRTSELKGVFAFLEIDGCIDVRYSIKNFPDFLEGYNVKLSL